MGVNRRDESRELNDVWATVAERRIYARASRNASAAQTGPTVLVHGFGMSSAYFVPLAERLAVEFPVYAPDLPGHGKSDKPCEPLNISQLADSLLAWMDALGLPRVAVVANSMGCQIAVDAAARQPNRFDRLVLLGPTIDPAARTFAQQAWRLFQASFHERLSLGLVLARDYARMGWRIVPEFRFMLQDRIEDKLPLVAAPVMLVRGEHDAVVPPRWLDEAARLTNTSQTVVIPGWGHAAHYSAARQVADVVAPFLREAAMTVASR